jgi:hypothetical protein
MKISILPALFGLALLAVVPAGASTANFTFMDCGQTNNPSCTTGGGSLGNSYAVASTGTTGVTATATAFFVTTISGTGSGTDMQTGAVGAYSSAGLGVCEDPTYYQNSGDNCFSPQHQIDNGANPVNAGPTTQQDWEFILIAFTGSAVDLNNVAIQLGNFNGGATDPFDVTYFTSSAATLTTAITSLPYASIAGTDGFGAAQSASCTAGATLDEEAQGLTTTQTGSNACTTEGMDTLSGAGTDVTYLLIGASVASNQVGDDYFKVQDIQANKASATPEPATFGLIGLSLAGLGLLRKKRKLN